MKSNTDDELSMNKIDDFNDKESKEKRNTVKLVIVFCIVVGVAITYFKTSSQFNDYVGTEEAPGIVTTKK